MASPDKIETVMNHAPSDGVWLKRLCCRKNTHNHISFIQLLLRRLLPLLLLLLPRLLILLLLLLLLPLPLPPETVP